MNQDYNFVNADPRKIEAEILKNYELLTNTSLYAGDPVRLFLESLAYVIFTLYNNINLAAEQNLLAYAKAGHLDELGQLLGTKRLAASKASLTQRFYLAQKLDFSVIIPQNTRVATADNKNIFIVSSNTVIAKGELFADILCNASQVGISHNNLELAQVNCLIDPVAYIHKTENITKPEGGADIESDESLRSRIAEAPEAFTNAGSVGAYRYHALAVHPDIQDLAVYCPVPGTVEVRPILKNGELPSLEILQAIEKKLSADGLRPLTDTVIVKAPELVSYNIDLAWSIAKDSSPLVMSITKKIETALDQYLLWQNSQIGRDINPTKLISLLEQAGARRIIITEPKFTELKAYEIAREQDISIQFLGVESE